MQALYYLDMNKAGKDQEESLDLFLQVFSPGEKDSPFFDRLVDGALGKKGVIDPIIEQYSSNWKLSRMSCVDRNILRIAVFELLYCDDIPFKVSINEAVDIGKKFGTEESGSFINGILDSIRKGLEQGKISL